MGRAVDTNPATNIWLACADGDFAAIKDLIANGHATANAQDEHGYSALHAAVSYDHTEIVEYLLKHGADVNIVDEDGDTPLHAAESVEMVQRLIAAGADPAARNAEGMTPLEVAFEDDREDVVAFLVNHYTEHGIAFTLPEEAAADEYIGLSHTLAADASADAEGEAAAAPSSSLASASQPPKAGGALVTAAGNGDDADATAAGEPDADVARIERTLAETDIDSPEGEAALRDAVTQFVVGRMQRS